VAESRQFGGPKIRQFGDKPGGNQPGDSAHCAQCEAMLADALDGTLSPADQELFDSHMALCGPCSQLWADAKRGAAWLGMLRESKPEPPAMMLERILAQTSGAHAGGQFAPAPILPTALPGMVQPAHVPGVVPTPVYANVLPFHRRATAAVRRSSFGQIMLQPRLAMTAAMAFFSIALTLNLTGVRLQDLRAGDLKPSSLKRDFYSANARVVQYYEGLRVVYELESRVHDLQSASDNDATTGSQTAPQGASPDQSAPGSQAQPGQATPEKQGPAAQPEQKQRPASGPRSGSGPGAGPAPNSGASRREGAGRMLSVAATNTGGSGHDLPAGPTQRLAGKFSRKGLQERLV
jgi:hypothetical protein